MSPEESQGAAFAMVAGILLLVALAYLCVALLSPPTTYQIAPPPLRKAPPNAVAKLRAGGEDLTLVKSMMYREVRREGYAEYTNWGGQVQPRRGARGIIVGCYADGQEGTPFLYVVQWTSNLSSRYSYGLHLATTTICPLEDLHVIQQNHAWAKRSLVDLAQAEAEARKLMKHPGEGIVLANGTIVRTESVAAA